MSRLEWDASLETGDATVDSQHRTLLGMFNELRDAAVSGRDGTIVREILERLTDYVATHFAAEQDLMIREAYPPDEVMAHVAEHTKLTARTREMVLEYHDGKMTTVLPLAEFLSTWLGTHIRQVDRKLIDHVRARGSAA